MRKITRLKRETLECCKFRGHAMSRFITDGPYIATACCFICDRTVTVNSRPLPNEIDIGGEAVALNCYRLRWASYARSAQGR